VDVGGGCSFAENGGVLVEDGMVVRGAATLRVDSAKFWLRDGVVSFSRQDLENYQVLATIYKGKKH
jgi:hypothetical protein